MATYLKQGKDAEFLFKADVRTQEIVREILTDIRDRGDEAVHELSSRFDNLSLKSFRLSNDQIQEAIDAIPEKIIDDLKFAQAHIRNFAEVQCETLLDVEVVRLPGISLEHKNIPVNSLGCIAPADCLNVVKPRAAHEAGLEWQVR